MIENIRYFYIYIRKLRKLRLVLEDTSKLVAEFVPLVLGARVLFELHLRLHSEQLNSSTASFFLAFPFYAK